MTIGLDLSDLSRVFVGAFTIHRVIVAVQYHSDKSCLVTCSAWHCIRRGAQVAKHILVMAFRYGGNGSFITYGARQHAALVFNLIHKALRWIFLLFC